MDQYVVVVRETGNESSDSSSDVLWVGVVFEVFVVCVNGYRFRCSAQEVSVRFQTTDYCEEFFVVDSIVLFGG